jgi:hypothetical protein
MNKLRMLLLATVLVGCATHQPAKRLNNLELYQMGMPVAARKRVIGRSVTLDLTVKMGRAQTLAEISIPPELQDRKKLDRPIWAHLLSLGSLSDYKTGGRLRINGIIVDEGYNAYMIYVQGVPKVLPSPPVTDVADSLAKILPPGWRLDVFNEIIRIESKQDVWLLGPSLPATTPGESEAHYAHKNGYKTKYEITLKLVPRLSDAQLEQIREERRPLERALEERANGKPKFSEAANALQKHPLPMFYTDDYSIFVEWPYGFYGVYPLEIGTQVEQIAASLKKLFHEYHTVFGSQIDIGRAQIFASTNASPLAPPVNPADWGPAYQPGIEIGPASTQLSKAFHDAEAFLAKQPFAKEYAKRACSGGGEPCDVEFALLADSSGVAKGIVRVNKSSGECVWMGDHLASPANHLSEEEMNRLWERVDHDKNLDRDTLRETLYCALVANQGYLRAKAAQQLGEVGDATSIPYLIDALNDDVQHVGAKYPDGGMNRTCYWANESLKKITRQDFGFHWNDSKAERESASKRWRDWFYKHYKK